MFAACSLFLSRRFNKNFKRPTFIRQFFFFFFLVFTCVREKFNRKTKADICTLRTFSVKHFATDVAGGVNPANFRDIRIIVKRFVSECFTFKTKKKEKKKSRYPRINYADC